MINNKYIAGIGIMVFVGALMLYGLFTLNIEKTGRAVDYTKCYDQDGGTNYYNASGGNWDYPGQGSCGNIDYCGGNTLYEVICQSDYECPVYINYNCLNGCNNGACINALDLSDYPFIFIKNNSLDGSILIGSDAHTQDMDSAMDIISSLQTEGYNTGAAYLDTSLFSYTDQNLIVVGNPCTNRAAAALLGKVYPSCGVNMSIPEDAAIIKLVQNSGNVALILAGWDENATQRAARVLAEYYYYALSGTELEVTGTSMTDIKVGIPSESCFDSDGGFNVDQKGFATFNYFLEEDKCFVLNSSWGKNYTDFCFGNNPHCYLEEFYCHENPSNGIMYEDVFCPAGCQNGFCLNNTYLCNNNGVCEPDENITYCASDCSQEKSCSKETIIDVWDSLFLESSDNIQIYRGYDISGYGCIFLAYKSVNNSFYTLYGIGSNFEERTEEHNSILNHIIAIKTKGNNSFLQYLQSNATDLISGGYSISHNYQNNYLVFLDLMFPLNGTLSRATPITNKNLAYNEFFSVFKNDQINITFNDWHNGMISHFFDNYNISYFSKQTLIKKSTNWSRLGLIDGIVYPDHHHMILEYNYHPGIFDYPEIFDMWEDYIFLSKTSEFSNELTTNLTNISLSNVTNFSVGVIDKAQVQFTQPLDLRNVDIEENIKIQNMVVSINSTKAPGLNKPAIIKMYNITLKNPIILKDGKVCNECKIKSYEGNTLTFNVSGWSEYSLTEGMVCGNGIIEKNITYQINYSNGTFDNITYNEYCEGQDLNNKSCNDFGYFGILTCDINCNFNFSSCYNYTCNNNSVCESNETKTTCPTDCLCTPGENRICYGGQGICALSFQRCDNSSRNWSVCFVTSPVNETCNNLDDDCDGEIDEGRDWNNDGEIDDDELFDYDEDGYFPNMTITHDLNCTGYDSDEIDCNDLNGSIHPNAKEKLNGVDDDCDDYIDENISVSNKTSSAEKIDLGILKKEGSKAYLRVGDWATFKQNDLMGKIEVASLTSTSASVSVTIITGTIKTLNSLTLQIGQTAGFDLDENGKNDISITLDGVQSSFKSILTVKDISELMSPPLCNLNSICDTGENAANCPADCLVVNYCNNNSVCEEKETLENCASDCKPEEKPPAVEQPEPAELTCNDNSVCEAWETKENCPKDCKGFDYKQILLYAGAVFLFLTITSSGIIIKKKVNPYKVKKSLKKSIVKALDVGYNIDTLGYYLAGQKLRPDRVKKALKYAADFMALKQAIKFYLAQGHKEDEIKQICKKNKWSGKITNEVFDDIHEQQQKYLDAQKNIAKPSLQKYQIKNFR